MSAALASLGRHRNVILVDVVLVVALYLVPSITHLTALPVYKLEPMRIALVIALLYTNRANSYLVAFTIPLASALISGHPEPFKALLMGIECSVLVAAYGYLRHKVNWSQFLALTVAILAGKILYYSLKFLSLDAGLLAGNFISTPVLNQVILAAGTAAVFAMVENRRTARLPG